MSDPISQHGAETLAEIFVDTATLTTRAFMPRLLRGPGAVVSMEGGDSSNHEYFPDSKA